MDSGDFTKGEKFDRFGKIYLKWQVYQKVFVMFAWYMKFYPCSFFLPLYGYGKIPQTFFL